MFPNYVDVNKALFTYRPVLTHKEYFNFPLPKSVIGLYNNMKAGLFFCSMHFYYNPDVEIRYFAGVYCIKLNIVQ
jgi:hypothetical protein